MQIMKDFLKNSTEMFGSSRILNTSKSAADRILNFSVEHEMHTIKEFSNNMSPDVLKFEKEINMDDQNGEQKIVPSKFKGEEISFI